MRSFVVCVLVTLMALTTPIGTGRGVHQADVLHPIFPHRHLLHGHIASDDDDSAQSATSSVQVTSRPPAGPALGAASGADAASMGTAISPTVPQFGLLPLSRQLGRLVPFRLAPPRNFLVLPEDPPPQPAA